jgi:hypothetical protein
MKSEEIKNKLNRFLQNVIQYLTIIFLYCKNKVIKRSLKLEKIHFLRSVSIYGCKVTIAWQVTGCHKITVQGHRVLPGNRHFLSVTLNHAPEYLVVLFHGIGKKEYRAFHLTQGRVYLSNQFLVHPKFPKISAINLPRNNSLALSYPRISGKVKLSSASSGVLQFVLKYSKMRVKKISLVCSPVISKQNIGIQFEPFNLNKYT